MVKLVTLKTTMGPMKMVWVVLPFAALLGIVMALSWGDDRSDKGGSTMVRGNSERGAKRIVDETFLAARKPTRFAIDAPPRPSGNHLLDEQGIVDAVVAPADQLEQIIGDDDDAVRLSAASAGSMTFSKTQFRPFPTL